MKFDMPLKKETWNKTTCSLMKYFQKKTRNWLDCYVLFWRNLGNYSRKQQPPISWTVKKRQKRNIGYGWRSKDELITDVLLWTFTHGHTSADKLANNYLYKLNTDIGGYLQDLLVAINDMYGCWERVRRLYAITTW